MREMEVTVADVLRARDARVQRQQSLLERFGCPLISFTMNIPGPVKRNEIIERGFQVGVERIEDALAMRKVRVLERQVQMEDTGCEAIWAVDAPAGALKDWMRAIEEADELGRLLDIDVLDAHGRKQSRSTARKCFLCGAPAHICARSRSHPLPALFEKSQQILEDFFQQQRAARIAFWAQQALLYEALVTPKPGLVDRDNNGAHRDMDIFSFASSASVLGDWFQYCARTGMNCPDSLQAFDRMRVRALRAEREMRRATGGVNTHKGALFALGILCCAVGSVGETADEKAILEAAAKMAQTALKEMQNLSPEDANTGGERQYLECGLTGARGEAAAGFTHVRKWGLPAMRAAAAAGACANDAGLTALMALMARVKDSNILRRRGAQWLNWAQERAGEVSQRPISPQALRELDAAFIREEISPGGSADLLAVTFFLYFATGGHFARGGF